MAPLRTEGRTMRTLAATMALLLAAVLADAATITVDWAGSGDYLTIQEGLDAADSGDTVLDHPGTYTGHLNRDLDFGGRGITLRSSSGAESTVINCQDAGRAVLFDDGEDSLAVLSGLTLLDGNPSGVGGAGVLVMNGSSPIIERCIFRSCNAGTGPGGGVAVISASALIRACEFRACRAGYGGGVYCESGSVALSDCDLTDTPECYPGRGGGLYATFSSVSILKCLFSNNYGGSRGSDVCLEYSDGAFTDCEFTRPPDATVGYYGSAYLYASSPTFSNCDFQMQYNTWAGVVTGKHSSPTYEWCTFGNCFSWSGAAIANFESTDIKDPVFRNCTFFGRIASGTDLALFVLDDCWPLIENCIISFSGAPEVMLAYGNADPAFVHCVVYDVAGAEDIAGPGTDNLLEDPLICDVYAYDFTLCENSPCLPSGNPWGVLVGARSRGCDSCSSPVEVTTWGAIKAMYR